LAVGEGGVTYEIEPYVGVGPLRFGMSREEVKRALGGEPRVFKKSPLSDALTDAFDESGVHIYYNADDGCCAVELATPASPVLNGQALLGRPFSELRAMFEELDPALKSDGAGLTSPLFGVSLYAPFARKEPEEPVEAVLAFEEGYND
jgi:hypothetical protein